MSSRARRAARDTLLSGARDYTRARVLHRLLKDWPTGFPQAEPERSREIVRRLAAALRAERALGRAGHWTYDLNRHIALRQAHLAEAAALLRARRRREPGISAQREGAPG
jgi:hypothetical protein